MQLCCGCPFLSSTIFAQELPITDGIGKPEFAEFRSRIEKYTLGSSIGGQAVDPLD